MHIIFDPENVMSYPMSFPRTLSTSLHSPWSKECDVTNCIKHTNIRIYKKIIILLYIDFSLLFLLYPSIKKLLNFKDFAD